MANLYLRLLLIIVILSFNKIALGQQIEPVYYNMGNPTIQSIWVDPVNGNDNNDGSARNKAFRSLAAAWQSMPVTAFTTGYKISLVAGNYAYRDEGTGNIVGLYLDERHGTYNCPIIIEAVDGPLTAHLYSALDFRDISYVYLIGLDFLTAVESDGGGNTVHFADGEYVFIKNCRINGFDGVTRKPQETLKVNQVNNIYVEDCDISGAFWFALDYVGVEYGHIIGCKIHDASEDALLLKGGTAQIRVEKNIVYNADRFGISVGQGAGFDFMVVPWLHYEAYDLKIFNNIVYNTNYAGLAVLGGYNILAAYNTFYKVGIDKTGDRTLLSIGLGQRGCDGAENDTCNAHHAMGGWSPGPWSTPPLEYGTEADCIPNRNVYIYNNIFFNPGADSTIGPHFEIRAPYDAADFSPTFLQTSNLPNPVLSDERLQIRGNIIWNGSAGKFLGLDENTGGQPSNPDCNEAQLIRDNSINLIEPQFTNASDLNFRPVNSSNIFGALTFAIPSFTGTDKPARPVVPTGNLINTIPRDYDGNTRSTAIVAGAYCGNNTTSFSISGQISYFNSSGHILDGLKIYLKNNSNTIIDSSITDAGGNYIFTNKSAGIYLVSPYCTRLWGGANATDALFILRYTVGLSAFTSIQQKAADVNGDGRINSTDALIVARRSIGQISSFSVGDWVFDNTNITISESNTVQNIYALCTGDVNGSYSFTTQKANNFIEPFLSINKIAEFNKYFEYPIKLTGIDELSAVTLAINYPENSIDISAIKCPLPGVITNIKNCKIYLSWYSLTPYKLNSEEAFITIIYRYINKPSVTPLYFAVYTESEFVNSAGRPVNEILLSSYAVNNTVPKEFSLSNAYPNPFNPSTEFSYYLPAQSRISILIYNSLGKLVKELYNGTKEAGEYKIKFEAADLSSGIYYLSFNGVENSGTNEFHQVRKCILIK